MGQKTWSRKYFNIAYDNITGQTALKNDFDTFQVSNISGLLVVCVTLMAVTARTSSLRTSMDGSGLLIKPGSIPQMELLSKTGPSPEGK